MSKNTTVTLKTIGTINIKVPEIMVSDPCYDIGTWCQGIIKDVAIGEYEVLYFEGYKSEYWPEDRLIGIYLKDCDIKYKNLKWEDVAGSFGMDAGMASISDMETYKKWRKEDESDKWWDDLCFGNNGMVANDTRILDDGIICNSGYGDGSYYVKEARNAENKVVAIMIEF